MRNSILAYQARASHRETICLLFQAYPEMYWLHINLTSWKSFLMAAKFALYYISYLLPAARTYLVRLI